MEVIENLAKIDYVLVIMSIFAILFGIKEIIEIVSYFKNKLRIKTGFDQDRETFENRISTLERHDNWQYKEISKISQCVTDIDKRMLDKDIDDMRWELLDFCSALTCGRKYNREAFDHIFRIYEKYEMILKDNKMTNGFVDESMNYVKEVYHKNLENGKF